MERLLTFIVFVLPLSCGSFDGPLCFLSESEHGCDWEEKITTTCIGSIARNKLTATVSTYLRIRGPVDIFTLPPADWNLRDNSFRTTTEFSDFGFVCRTSHKAQLSTFAAAMEEINSGTCDLEVSDEQSAKISLSWDEITKEVTQTLTDRTGLSETSTMTVLSIARVGNNTPIRDYIYGNTSIDRTFEPYAISFKYVYVVTDGYNATGPSGIRNNSYCGIDRPNSETDYSKDILESMPYIEYPFTEEDGIAQEDSAAELECQIPNIGLGDQSSILFTATEGGGKASILAADGSILAEETIENCPNEVYSFGLENR